MSSARCLKSCKVPISEASIARVGVLVKEAEAFKLWVQSTEPLFIEMETDWVHKDIKAASTKMIGSLDSLKTGLEKYWNDGARELAEHLQKKTPNSVMLNQSRLLTDEALRLSLRTATTKLFNSKLVGAAADMLTLIRLAEAPGVGFKIAARNALSSARAAGKLAVCVNWAIDEVTKFKPKDAADLVAHGKATHEKLKLKGLIAKVSENYSHKARIIAVLIRS